MSTFEPYPLEHVHRLVEPGPTLLVSTSDGERANLMTNGFNMPVRHGGLVALVLGPWDASFATLRSTGECVLAIPAADLAAVTVDIGNCSGTEVDKWARFGLTQVPAEHVRAPLVAECAANLECRVADDRLVDDHALWVLEVVAAWRRPDAPDAPEIHHRGNGTFTTNGEHLDLRDRMTKWPHLV